MSRMSPHEEQLDSTLLSDKKSIELKATIAMCKHCFDVLIRHLHLPRRQTGPLDTAMEATPEFVEDLPHVNITCPLFVTWDKRKHANTFELRGCIGSLAPQLLLPAVGEYALRSALNDRRFRPINAQEVKYLRVAVSLLVNYEPCQHALDWIVGLHGILISWKGQDGRDYSATYLPEVAKEQGWDQRKAVESLIRKAGWIGAVTDAMIKSIACTRYQSSKLRMTFDEYVKQRGDAAKLVLLTTTTRNQEPRTPVRPDCRIS